MGKKRRKYTMSDKARAQRRGAAHKHGIYAQTTTRQVLPPCRSGTCPLGPDHYPCTVRVTMDDRDEALERCPLPLVTDPDVAERVAEAIREGDPTKIADVQGLALTAAIHIRDRGLKQLFEEGLSVEKVLSLDEEGNPLATNQVQHPATWGVVELLKHTGATADQQAITPKSRAERDRDVSLGEALSFIARKRQALAALDEEGPK